MASTKHRRQESAPGWAWMLFGLSIGLAVALFVYLKSGQPLPYAGGAVTAGVASAETIRAPEPTPPADEAREEPRADVADAAVAEAPGTELSFYTDLGQTEVIVPDNEYDFASLADPPRAVIIQAGSFPAMQRADRRRSELALLGIESAIVPAVVDGVTYYRVNVGPLRERGEINGVLRRLRERGIENFPREVPD